MRTLSTVLFCFLVMNGPAAAQPDTVNREDFQRDFDKALEQWAFGDELDSFSAQVLARTERFVEAVIGRGAAGNATLSHAVFRPGSQSERFCRMAAFDRASYVFNDIEYGEITKGFARIAVDIEKDLFSLGGSSIAEFVVGKTKSKIEEALKNAAKEYGQALPTASYRHSPGFLGFGVPQCEPELFLRWDIKSSRYDVWIRGDCEDEEVRVKTGDSKTIDYLGAWMVHITGESKFRYDEQAGALVAYIPNGGPPPTLGIAVECDAKEESSREVVKINARTNASAGGIGADTGLYLVEGDRLIIKVDPGMKWSAGDSDPCSRVSNADGIERCYGNHDQAGLSTRHGTLVGRIGEGAYFVVGTDYDVHVEQSGPLRLYYWDSHAEDNEGTIEADVEVRRVD